VQLLICHAEDIEGMDVLGLNLECFAIIHNGIVELTYERRRR